MLVLLLQKSVAQMEGGHALMDILMRGAMRWSPGEEVHLSRINDFDAQQFLDEHPHLPAEVESGGGPHIGEAQDKVRMLRNSLYQLQRVLDEGRASGEDATTIQEAIDKANNDIEIIDNVLGDFAV